MDNVPDNVLTNRCFTITERPGFKLRLALFEDDLEVGFALATMQDFEWLFEQGSDFSEDWEYIELDET